MNWMELSSNAQSVIEWIENPFTGKRETVSIKVGELFFRDGRGTGDVNIPITKDLFEEIQRFVSSDSNIQSVISLDGELMFSLHSESNLKLH